MRKLCFVTAAPLTLRAFMRNHMLRLAERYEVTAISDFNAEDLLGDWLPGVRLVSIPIKRQINLLADLRALAALWRFFRSERFDAVHSVTPKAGLLAMTAARWVGVSHRIHNLSGQVWATRRGFSRALLKNADRVTAANATHLLSDSLSQISFLESEGVVGHGRAEMLCNGSICGVDIARFRENLDRRKVVRANLRVPDTALLLLFVGRLNRDKGVLDLAKAFAQLARDRDDVWLVVVGHDEAGVGTDFDRLCGDAVARVRRIGHTEFPEHFMSAADIFLLPSYRESFGVTVIEAAACGVPAVASRICGLTDAVEEDVTGLMHPPGDVAALCDCLKRLCTDSTLRLKMGNAARARAHADFPMHAVTAAFVEFYEKLLRTGQGG